MKKHYECKYYSFLIIHFKWRFFVLIHFSERVNDPLIDVVYPKQADEGIWAGEGVVKGFVKERNFGGLYKSTWWHPNFYSSIHYSEILDKYMTVIVTEKTNVLVDKHEGFDNYLLKTPVQDLKSRLALRLRRKLLLSLARGDYYPNDEKMHQYIKEKYAEFVIPLEEAQWIGLSESEALTKLKADEALKLAQQNRPLKELFTQELLQKIKDASSSTSAKTTSKTTELFGSLFKKKWNTWSKSRKLINDLAEITIEFDHIEPLRWRIKLSKIFLECGVKLFFGQSIF